MMDPNLDERTEAIDRVKARFKEAREKQEKEDEERWHRASVGAAENSVVGAFRAGDPRAALRMVMEALPVQPAAEKGMVAIGHALQVMESFRLGWQAGIDRLKDKQARDFARFCLLTGAQSIHCQACHMPFAGFVVVLDDDERTVLFDEFGVHHETEECGYGD